MSFEERMEFLRQSIESHDRQIGELTDQIASVNQKTASLDAQLAALGQQLASLGRKTDERFDRFAELTQLNFDRLTKAMTGLTDLVANHERRIGRLEEGHAG